MDCWDDEVKASKADLKEIYSELGNNFRHYVAWRRFLFAGYFAIIAALGTAYKWDDFESNGVNRVLLVSAIVVSIIFWLLDARNRDLIRIISDSGAALEEKMELGKGGSYSNYAHAQHKFTHSAILKVFYFFVAIAFAGVLVSTY